MTQDIAGLCERLDAFENFLANEEAELIAEASSTIERLQGELADVHEVLADKRRLTRNLDVAMNGIEGAAEQASLCDLVDCAADLRNKFTVSQDRVAKLEQECQHSMSIVAASYRRAEEAEDRVAKLEEALMPFAKLGKRIELFAKQESLDPQSWSHEVKWDVLLRARNALEQKT